MEGGGSGSNAVYLSDIGDYKNTDDLYTIFRSSLFTIFLSILATRIGNVGGLSLNTYFDVFGLEGILSNTMLVTILFQIARYFYTVVYANYDKGWSPFVFICVLLVIQFIHDLLFYYGIINILPSGKNDMIDRLKLYSKENSYNAIGGHSAFIILTAVVAMITNDMDMLSKLIMLGITFYLIPYSLSIVYKKPPPPPPPEKKKESMRDARGFY
jgi:hypothetical protein